MILQKLNSKKERAENTTPLFFKINKIKKMKTLTLNRISDSMVKGFLYLCVAWTICALIFQLFFVYLQVTGQEERSLKIANHLTWKFDGSFKNSPGNIFYEGPVK